MAKQHHHFVATMSNGIVQRDAPCMIAGVQLGSFGNQEVGDFDSAPEGGPVQGSLASVIAAFE